MNSHSSLSPAWDGLRLGHALFPGLSPRKKVEITSSQLQTSLSLPCQSASCPALKMFVRALGALDCWLPIRAPSHLLRAPEAAVHLAQCLITSAPQDPELTCPPCCRGYHLPRDGSRVLLWPLGRVSSGPG